MSGPGAVDPSPDRPHGAPLAELRQLCLTRLDPASIAGMAPDRLAIEVERLLADIATDRRIQLNGREQRQLAGELVNDMLGLGPLEPLLEDETVADIMVNGPDKVFVERAGRVYLSNVKFRDAAHVANICQRIAADVGRRVDESSPMADARLKDGSRVNIVFPPLALDGPYISIRKFSKKRIDFAKLVEYGSMTAPVARILEIAGRCRLNIIISGGTGSGKTTLLNAVSQLIDPASASSPSRTRRNCSCSSPTSCGWRPGRPRWRAGARSPSATWCATRCGCGRTASSSARCAAARRSTCCRR